MAGVYWMPAFAGMTQRFDALILLYKSQAGQHRDWAAVLGNCVFEIDAGGARMLTCERFRSRAFPGFNCCNDRPMLLLLGR